jgi:hypothetical protein
MVLAEDEDKEIEPPYVPYKSPAGPVSFVPFFPFSAYYNPFFSDRFITFSILT